MKMTALRFPRGFRVLGGNKCSQAATMVIPPGGKEGGPDNNHRGADQWLYVVSGKGTVLIAGRRKTIFPSTLVLIERGQNHEIRNLANVDLVTLNFYVPPAYTKTGPALPAARPRPPRPV